MKFTVIASINPQVLSKRYSFDDAGDVRKTTSAKMVEGTAHVVQVGSLQSFADELTALAPNQALAFGVTLSQTAKMLSKEAYKAAGCPRDTITRTRERTSVGPLAVAFFCSTTTHAIISHHWIVTPC
ncbi:MAG: hypothetical protein IPM37_03690 [Hahellaceae bacterium]|nr:hypothetical protein [Hahellaceae bacterium]